ncbi:carbohydrate porin [Methylomicrobium sp. Wu6]|uniref:carbohydrate porin n=1 Tax=Methylomicrobium sp. Wu6 TaxID=3107928 RepID=UPI002DD62044|nr:carbohydrate porin [Methylomicrobium sp. Wu6]MEC4747926.1 carbohydrate porin [Methylomicrobium sp. Wu6]
MHIFIRTVLFGALAFSHAVQSGETPGGATYSGELFSRSTLTGDWGGVRNDMAEHGVTLDLNATHVTQHAASGGYDGSLLSQFPGNRISQSFPRLKETASDAMFNMLLKIDTGKAGLWPGGFLTVRGEGRVGDSLGIRTGGLMPSNGDALSPQVPNHANQEVLALTELTYAQFLSEKFGVAFGLMNVADGDKNEFAGNLRSRSQFMNVGMRISPVMGAVVPLLTTLGATVIIHPTKNIIGTAGFINAEETAGYNPFERNKGTTFLTEWQFKHTLAGLPGKQTFGFAYGFDRKKLDYGTDPRLHLASILRTGEAVKTNADIWALYYNAHQYIQGDSKGGWGPFVRAGVSDGHPNPVKWSVAFGLGGVGVGSWRPHDNWGIGGYALGASDEPTLNRLGIHDETGLEAFYNAAFTPWLHVTADVQYVNSALTGANLPGLGHLPAVILPGPKEAWVVGVRTNLDF